MSTEPKFPVDRDRRKPLESMAKAMVSAHRDAEVDEAILEFARQLGRIAAREYHRRENTSGEE